MIEPARVRTREQVGVWPPSIGGWRWRGLPRPSVAVAARLAALRRSAEAEFAPGRLLPWLPMAFGLGIALYFAAEHEPSLIVAGLAFTSTTVAVWAARRNAIGFPLALGLAGIAAGFACATLKQVIVAHPVLTHAAYNVMLTGFVEIQEERERSDRIVIRVTHIEGLHGSEDLERVRVSVRKGSAPAVGSFVSLKARLTPPLQPLRPNGYDFARDLYFQRIGASGFVTGAIKIETPPVEPGLGLRIAAAIEGIRDAIDGRIRSVIKGDGGSIASALLTGKRDAISTPVNDAMFISSLGHVLSISGYHMAVVAGLVFFLVRASLALIPGLAARHPIKKWSAAAALIATTAYLFLSGAEVATQRSYIMIAIVLCGVLIDRPALTIRTLAVAAFAVLVLSPEAVVHPSFQMSFAATLGLVCAYERGLPLFRASADSPLGARLALWGVREVVSLTVASFVAGLATTPYAAFHFHRGAPYGVIANLTAMPVVSALVMPAGLLGLVAMPFGFDGVFWWLMEIGIRWMVTVSLWVASLPGAVGHVPAFGTGTLLVATAGLLVLCLLRTRLRWLGAGLGAVACVLVVTVRQPDIYIAPNGEAVAVRGPDGTFAIAKIGNDSFAVREWLAADGDPRLPTDKSLADGFACDPSGCVSRLGDGSVVAMSRTAEALAEDCTRADLIVTQRRGPPDCAATIIDRDSQRAGGARALWRVGRSWQQRAATPPGTARPWAAGEVLPGLRSAAQGHDDATPQQTDLPLEDQ